MTWTLANEGQKKKKALLPFSHRFQFAKISRQRSSGERLPTKKEEGGEEEEIKLQERAGVVAVKLRALRLQRI